MILKLFSVRDAKAQTYGPPFCKGTPGEAQRDFQTITNDKQSFVSQYPEDYDLYEMAEMDTVTGKIKTLDTPHHICKAVDMVKVQN